MTPPPSSPAKVALAVRVPPQVKGRIRTIARANGLTPSGLLLMLITRELAALNTDGLKLKVPVEA